ncbi:MAG TPA: twin-arginine translocation signal domain-containing protein [Bryobacteraceae bacterium]|nr:twin-arginine translocation signal domain-containing protein [Bryobacteraceae bacterium]
MVNRRQFIKSSAVSAAALGVAQADGRGVSIVVDTADPVAQAAQSLWAARELEQALSSRRVTVFRCANISGAKAGDLCIVAAGASSTFSLDVLKRSRATVAAVPEALGLLPASAADKKILLACGHDAQGLTYALLDLADRVQHTNDPLGALAAVKATAEQPANAVRSMTRLFTSDVEDKPWYNDREMWPAYLTTLAAQRFNRFNLALGIGYDFIRQVTDAYFVFSYPFLLPVPGYQVRVPQLPDAERDSNLAMLKFISEQTVARGMHFQLGLWMHGYEWIDSPNPNYTIEGVTKANHGSYCRDAVRLLLQSCPAIGGITFRVHGESGVTEGSYDFWKMVFDGVATCGRKVEIDMHPKGMDQTMLDLGAATRLPFRVSPKFWAEHIGMTYHQAEIRELEQPHPGKQTTELMKLSAGSRSFLRYGYGDLLKEDRPYSVTHRIWPGSQRLLLWGDPRSAAAYSRAFRFCGSDGVEICEPLSFKGRRGSGIAGDRCAYADASLKPRWDWQKYLYGTRVWGRLLYNPDCDPEAWRRYLHNQFGDSAAAAESALANASRILPIVTTAHGASAANNSYWPEIYFNQSLVDGKSRSPYSDSPEPRVFGNVSPFDPQLFSRINDFADALLEGESDGKYSPVEVAQWIEDYAEAASKDLEKSRGQTSLVGQPEYRRLAIDVTIQVGLGRFFAAKFRSGVLYRVYEKTNSRAALEASLEQYSKARAAWAALAEVAKPVYLPDITVGERPNLRGHWLDRLPAIDRDIAAVRKQLEKAQSGDAQPNVARAIKQVLGRPGRVTPNCTHKPPAGFRAGEAVDITVAVPGEVDSVRLFYRHVDQAERFQILAMEGRGHAYRAAIPATYTNAEFPLQYYFEVRKSKSEASLYPGLGVELINQPYFVLRRT